MKLIEVVLRDSPVVTIPVTITRLKTMRKISTRNEIYLSSSAIGAYIKESIHIGDAHEMGMGYCGGLNVNSEKKLSITHGVSMESSASPAIISEAGLIGHSISIGSEIGDMRVGVYSTLSEVDSLTLGDIDNEILQDIEHTEAKTGGE